MTDVHIYAGTLIASHSDRTATGLLVPYGEECSSNLGRFAVEPGAITIPSDVTGLALNTDHERESVVGGVTRLEETPTGIVGHFAFAATPEGDRALADARAGRRAKLSVEAKNMVIRAGKAVGGRIFGAALVKAGAFPSATLLAAAVDLDEQPADDTTDDEAVTTTEHNESEYTDAQGITWRRVEDVETTTEQDKTTTTTTVVEETEDPEAPETEEEEEPVTTATAPATLTARRSKAAAPAAPSFGQIMRAINEVKSGRGNDTLLAMLRTNAGPGSETLFAALNSIPYTSAGGANGAAPTVGEVINPFPQWIGQLWDGLAYTRDIIDLLGTAELTAATIAGWKWETKPEGGDWSGNKTNVPSNTPKAVPFSAGTHYWAGAHDHANEYRHFSNPEYWESYYNAMRESYARWSNEYALTEVVQSATAVAADAVPAGLTAGLSYLIDGIVEVIDGDALPNFAIVEKDLYKAMLKTTNNNVLGYLDASLGFDNGTLAGSGFTIRAKSRYTARDEETNAATVTPFEGVIVGAKEAVTVYELPGVPIRIEAEDLVKGGLDTGLFGYTGHVTHKAEALVHVTGA
ncbi:hypothetical protein KXS11_03420 [Plantibacter flavus]|uniref:hypothetical protein n=1 Tax=Plantibacter flavus TaxID=150123 RepID=UPI003F1486CA